MADMTVKAIGLGPGVGGANAESSSSECRCFPQPSSRPLSSIGIVLALAGGAAEFLRRLGGLGLLFDPQGWFPRSNAFDVRAIFAGSVIVSVIAMFVAARSAWGLRCTSPSLRVHAHGAA